MLRTSPFTSENLGLFLTLFLLLVILPIALNSVMAFADTLFCVFSIYLRYFVWFYRILSRIFFGLLNTFYAAIFYRITEVSLRSGVLVSVRLRLTCRMSSCKFSDCLLIGEDFCRIGCGFIFTTYLGFCRSCHVLVTGL